MKPLLLAITLLAAPLAMGTGHAHSASDALYEITGVATGSVVNVRKGPGPSNPVIAKLAADRMGLSVVDCTAKGDWCQITDGQGLDGWVAARFLQATGTEPEPAPAWRSKFTTEIPYRVTGIGAGSSLNMRAGPGTGNAVIAKLPAESSLMILDCIEAGDWCKVTAGGDASGWVATRFLGGVADTVDATGKPVAEQRTTEATRLATVTGIRLESGKATTIPELPPYLLGNWDVDRAACQRSDSPTRVTVQPNGLRVGASNARFKSAIFQDEGYDLIALLMETEEAQTTIPQRALYRLEPQGETMALSGDVLTEQILHRCPT